MSNIAQILFYVSATVSFVCFVLVLIATYQNSSPTLAIVCAVLVFVGIGGLIAFIYGWIKSSEWGITRIMLFWTIAAIVAFITHYIAPLPFTRSDLPDV